jgi:hypothetical protein
MRIAGFAGMKRALLLVSATLVQAMSAPTRAEEASVPITYSPIVRPQPEVSGPAQAPAAPSPAVQAPTQAEPAPTLRQWYGSQVLLADGVSFLLGVGVARAGGGDGGLMVAAAGWVVGGPAVHAVHHRPGTALASLVMRAGLTLLPYYAGGPCKTTCTTAVGSCADDPNASDHWQTQTTTCNGAMGLLLGSMIASAIDSAFLSWQEVPVVAAPQVATPAHRRVAIDSAGVFPLDAGAGLSLGGRF